MMTHLATPLLLLGAVLASGCTQPGSARTLFVLGPVAGELKPYSPVPQETASVGGGQPSASPRPANGTPATPRTGGSGGGGAAPAPVNGPSAQAITSGLFDARWLAGAVPGGPARPDAFANASFRQLAGIVTSAAGEVFLCDRGMNQIIALPTTGTPAVLCGAGDGSAGYWGEDLAAIASALDAPTGLARDDANGVLYVADTGNRRIRHFMPGGRLYTLAGGGADPADSVSQALDARLGEVHGLALDVARNFYFSEHDTGKVRRIAAGGQLSTLATLTPGATRAVAAARAGDRLWVAHGSRISVLDLTVSPPVVTPVLTTAGTAVTALAYDQVGTLYFTETAGPAGAGTFVRALALAANGTAAPGRVPATVAGTGLVSDTGPDYAMPAAPVPDARTQALAGAGACSLYLDLHHAASPTVLSGILFVGSSFQSSDGTVRWGQVGRLEPQP